MRAPTLISSLSRFSRSDSPNKRLSMYVSTLKGSICGKGNVNPRSHVIKVNEIHSSYDKHTLGNVNVFAEIYCGECSLHVAAHASRYMQYVYACMLRAVTIPQAQVTNTQRRIRLAGQYDNKMTAAAECKLCRPAQSSKINNTVCWEVKVVLLIWHLFICIKVGKINYTSTCV